MAIVKVQWSFQGISNLPRDQYVNTWYFQTATIPGSNLAGLIAAVGNFYTAAATGATAALFSKMSALIDTNNAVAKAYDVGAPLHSPPLTTISVALPTSGGGSGTVLPTELAACLSYKANFPTSVDPRRRRGRIYVGPLNTTALQSAPTADATLLVSFCQDMIEAAQEMASVALGIGYEWSVFSKTDGVAYSIDEVWVDNAVDVQRRRGIRATSRVTGPVP